MSNYDDTGFGSYENGGGGGGGGGYGGGYMSGSSPQKSSKEHGSFQTVTPLTIRMIKESHQNPSDDSLQIDGKTVQKVVVYAKVLDVVNKHTNTEYVVDDSTEVMKIIQYVSDDNQNPQQPAQIGDYVYINGAIRSVEGERTVLAHHVRVVSDHNEITHHLLSVVFTHYQNLKGPLNDGAKLRSANAGTFGNNNMGGGGFNNGGFVIDNPIQAVGGGMDQQTDSKLVHDAFAADSITDTGLSVTDVASQLANRGFNVQKVRQICDSLMNDGYLYSTVDDNHFKSTGSFL